MFSYTRKAVLEEWTYDEHGNLEQHVVYETKDSHTNLSATNTLTTHMEIG